MSLGQTTWRSVVRHGWLATQLSLVLQTRVHQQRTKAKQPVLRRPARDHDGYGYRAPRFKSAQSGAADLCIPPPPLVLECQQGGAAGHGVCRRWLPAEPLSVSWNGRRSQGLGSRTRVYSTPRLSASSSNGRPHRHVDVVQVIGCRYCSFTRCLSGTIQHRHRHLMAEQQEILMALTRAAIDTEQPM
jgi:hypothetical protein